jgi:hypothetical protein
VKGAGGGTASSQPRQWLGYFLEGLICGRVGVEGVDVYIYSRTYFMHMTLGTENS